MCNPASFVLTKTDVLWSKCSDDHERIIEEYHLRDQSAMSPGILRVEINPPGGDWNAPLEQWVYRVDQDTLPIWADAENDEARARRALESWAMVRLVRHTPANEPREVKAGEAVFALGNSQVTALENSQVTARGDSQVTALGNAQVTALENSQVTALGNAQVTARGNSQVTALGNSQVTALGNSQVTAWGNSQVTARGNSQVTARGNAQVTALGNAQVTALENSQVTARGDSQVTAWGNAQVTAWGNSTIVGYKNMSPGCLQSSQAVLIDRSGKIPVCYVGPQTKE